MPEKALTCTTARWPLLQAIIKAVSPSCVAASRFPPKAIMVWVHIKDFKMSGKKIISDYMDRENCQEVLKGIRSTLDLWNSSLPELCFGGHSDKPPWVVWDHPFLATQDSLLSQYISFKAHDPVLAIVMRKRLLTNKIIGSKHLARFSQHAPASQPHLNSYQSAFLYSIMQLLQKATSIHVQTIKTVQIEYFRKFPATNLIDLKALLPNQLHRGAQCQI